MHQLKRDDSSIRIMCSNITCSASTKKKNVLEIDSADIYAWSDSKIVLAWIKQSPLKWKTYIAHRVAEIQSFKHIKGWK